MIIGRIEEKKKLLKANDSEYSQFVTVFGSNNWEMSL